jgi:hypothetical protein
LRSQVEAFEQRDSHTITVEVDADAGEHVFYVHELESVDPDWGLMIGDCIHSARASLDFLMVRLWALVTGKNVREIDNVAFPIFSPKIPDPIEADTDLAPFYDSARSDFVARTREYRKSPLFSGYLARIEELQPFNQGNPSIWGPPRFDSGQDGVIVAGMHPHPLPSALGELAKLDNIAKHRAIHPSWVSVNAWRALHRDFDISFPPEFKQRGRSIAGDPLKDGAEVGRIQFEAPLPSEWQPADMDMKRAFPLQVALYESGITKGVLEVLDTCLWGAHSVLTIFVPVFTKRQPPLPVTAIPYPG